MRSVDERMELETMLDENLFLEEASSGLWTIVGLIVGVLVIAGALYMGGVFDSGLSAPASKLAGSPHITR